MRQLTLAGSPQAMGEQFGETFKVEIEALYQARIQNAILQAKAYGGRDVDEAQILGVAERCVPIMEQYHPAGGRELAGIAEGAGKTLTQVWAMNQLTDLRDIMAFSDGVLDRPLPEGEGCSSFVVPPSHAREGAGLSGQSWDLATDNMPYVLMVRREPTEGPKTLCLTLVGCLSLIGMNEHGLCVGTTNLRTKDAQLGVGYLDIIHKALHQDTLEDAVAAVETAPRAGAHYYYLMDAQGAAAAVECTAQSHERLDVQQPYVHCNHFLTARFQKIEARTPVASTHHRQNRMEALVASKGEALTVDDFKTFLGDHDGAPNCVCRHDANGISSNGSVIMDPANRKVHAVWKQACEGAWESLDV